MVTHVPAKVWNNLEMRYRQQLSKIKQAEAFEQDIDWLGGIPVKELTARGAIAGESCSADPRKI